MPRDNTAFHRNTAFKVHLIKGIAPVFRDETFLACGKSLLHSVLLTENFCHIFHINQIGVLIRSYDSVEYQKKKLFCHIKIHEGY